MFSFRCMLHKLFWVVCITLSWYGCVILVQTSYIAYKEDPISFGAETSYLEWDTKFPTIAICESDNENRIADYTDNLYGDPHDYNLDEVIKELAFFRGLSYYTLQLCTGKNSNPDCPKNNFTLFSDTVRSGCKDIFQKCKWNNIEFNCCEYFAPIDTEIGICFAINTVQSRVKTKRFPLVSNRVLGPGSLKLEMNVVGNVYMLNEEEVPALSTLQTDFFAVSPHTLYRRYISVQEIENESGVRDVAIDKRKCRYADENMLDVYKKYSYSACIVQCRKDAMFERCNCSHHLMPNTKPWYHCDMNGIKCLNTHYNELAVIKAAWTSRNGLICDCIPSCTETELYVVKDEKKSIDGATTVEFILEHLPTERYKRRVVRGRLDLVVSVGGTAALFVGASLLSFVEIFYFLALRVLSATKRDVRY